MDLTTLTYIEFDISALPLAHAQSRSVQAEAKGQDKILR